MRLEGVSGGVIAEIQPSSSTTTLQSAFGPPEATDAKPRLFDAPLGPFGVGKGGGGGGIPPAPAPLEEAILGRGGGGGIGFACGSAAGKIPPEPGSGGGIGVGGEGDDDTGGEDGDARGVATAAEEEGAPVAGGCTRLCIFSLSVGDERGEWGEPRKHASSRLLIARKRNNTKLDPECDRRHRAAVGAEANTDSLLDHILEFRGHLKSRTTTVLEIHTAADSCSSTCTEPKTPIHGDKSIPRS